MTFLLFEFVKLCNIYKSQLFEHNFSIIFYIDLSMKDVHFYFYAHYFYFLIFFENIQKHVVMPSIIILTNITF